MKSMRGQEALAGRHFRRSTLLIVMMFCFSQTPSFALTPPPVPLPIGPANTDGIDDDAHDERTLQASPNDGIAPATCLDRCRTEQTVNGFSHPIAFFVHVAVVWTTLQAVTSKGDAN